MTTVSFQPAGGDPISDRLKEMLERGSGSLLQSYLKVTVYQQYQQFQIARWQSGGDGSHDVTTSEGDMWPALNERYRNYKKKKFSAFDYGGSRMMVATGALLKSVVGPGNGQNLLVSPTQMVISTTVPYAEQVNAMRYFGNLGEDSMNQIRAGIAEFVMRGQ